MARGYEEGEGPPKDRAGRAAKQADADSDGPLAWGDREAGGGLPAERGPWAGDEGG